MAAAARPPTPASARAMARAALLQSGIGKIGTPATRSIGGEGDAAVAFEGPWPIYTLRPEALASAAPLSRARATAWFLVARRTGRALAVIELLRSRGVFTVARIVHGAAAREVSRALRTIAKAGVRGVVRRVRCHATGLDAAWIHGRARDVLVPIPSVPTGIDAFRAYEASQVLAILATQESLRRRELGTWSSPGRPRWALPRRASKRVAPLRLAPPPRPSLLG